MDRLFRAIEGRISRKQYWISSLMLFLAMMIVVLIVAAIGTEALGHANGAVRGAETLITTLMLAASVPIVVKRLQDRNKSPHYAWLLYGPALISAIGDKVGFTGTAPELNMLGYALALFNLIIGIWFFVELGFLRGTPGPNGYGPDPLAAKK
jgi:uncharacterized membrane protein YhaH (DUF805 family)